MDEMPETSRPLFYDYVVVKVIFASALKVVDVRYWFVDFVPGTKSAISKSNIIKFSQ